MKVPAHFQTTLFLAGSLALAGALRAQDNSLQRTLPAAGVLVEAVGERARNKVDFSGQKTFTEDQLRAPLAEQLHEIAEHGVTPARADDTAFYVGTFYRKAGFSQVQVDYEIHGEKMLIKIKEGPRSLLRKIIFIGNHTIPEATLYDYMIGATPARLAKEPEQFPYTAAEISAGADRVRGLYLSEGYLKVAVDAAGVQFSPDGSRADVTVRIDEGTLFTIGEVRFEGDTLYPRDQLVKALGEPITGPFSPGKADAMQRNLQSFYKAHGYYQAEVAVAADPALAVGGKVPVTYTVHPQHLFRFGWTMVRNDTERPRLRADFLPKRFAYLKGQTYDPDKLDETFREMLRTGLFSSLRVTPVASDGDEVRLDFTATEAKSREIGFTLGAGSYDGVSVGIRAADRDLFGRGRPLTFSAEYSQRGVRGELLYVDPWIFDTRFALRTRIFSESRDEEGYSKDVVGFRADLSRKVWKHLELGTFVEGATVKVSSLGIDESLLGPLDYTLATIGLTQNSDFRNDPINPGRGFVLSSAFDFSTIDGAAAFTRGTVRFSYYLPLGKTLLALGARGGYISPILDQLPIDVRFFNGGGTTVRSFAERELGPKDSQGNPLGGDVYTALNAELIFPITGGFQGAFFVDAGSLKNDDVPGSGDLRYGVGAGLRYKLPIGPLRLDYGFNPDRRQGEDMGAFHFSFGFAF